MVGRLPGRAPAYRVQGTVSSISIKAKAKIAVPLGYLYKLTGLQEGEKGKPTLEGGCEPSAALGRGRSTEKACP